jgi:hypothetical protein
MRRVFVVGSPRSGTTLVQSVLASHPRVWSLPETHFFLRAVPSGRRRVPGLASAEAGPALRDVARLAHAAAPALPRVPTIGRYARAFVRILDEAAVRAGCDAWVEKTPDHAHRIAAIERHVPGARFVHVVRNGADVVASVVAVSAQHPELWGGPRSVAQAAANWAADVAITARYARRPNHTVVRYERLIEHGASLEDVWRRLDLHEAPARAGDTVRRTEAIVTDDEPWKASVRDELFDGRGRRLESLEARDRDRIAAATAAGQQLLEELWPLR